MMYDEIGLEPIVSATSEESIQVARPIDGARLPLPDNSSDESLLDERLTRIIRALDR
jgi:hypothetical protein